MYDTSPMRRATRSASSLSFFSASFLTRYSPGHLLDEQLRVRDDADLVQSELERLLEPGDQRAVLGDVVRRDADSLAVRCQERSVVGLQHVAVRGRAGIAARAAVGEQRRPHASKVSSILPLPSSGSYSTQPSLA